jgi:hypothetical protein
MLPRPFIYTAAFLAALIGCSGGSSKPPATTGGAGGAPSMGGAGGAGGTSGSGGMTGTGGAAGGGAGGSTTTDGGNADAPEAGSAVGVPACAPVTQTSTAALSLMRMDLNARRVMNVPSPTLTKIEYDPMNKVLVAMSHAGAFWRIDPVANTATPIESGYTFTGEHRGLDFAADGTMYVLSASNSTTSTTIAATIRKGVGAMGSRTWTTLATTEAYPTGSATFNHSYSGLTLSPDGQYLFFSSGSRSDHGEVEPHNLVTGAPMGTVREVALTSAVFRIPTATVSMLPNDDAMLKARGFLFADGTRNTFDMAFNTDGDLIGPDNGPDMDFPDEINWLQEGKHYGFPWRLATEGNPNMDPTFTPAGDTRLHTGLMAVDQHLYFYDANFPTPPAGLVFADPFLNHGPDANRFIMGKMGTVQRGPMSGITPHRSPLGIVFDKGALCGDYYKAGFMLSYGPVVPAFDDLGEDLLLLKLTKVNGTYEMTATQIARGIRTPIDSALVGNKLYTVSYGPGLGIYEFTFPLPQ